MFQNLPCKKYVSIMKVDLETFEFKKEKLSLLKETLYGICNACDYWEIVTENHFVNDLKISSVVGNGALYVNRKNGKVTGTSPSYVDDSLNSGGDIFQIITVILLQVLKSKLRLFECFDFSSVQIETTAASKFKLSQKYYIKNLDFALQNTSFEELRHFCVLFSWMGGHFRSDLLCSADNIAQVSKQNFSSQTIQDYNTSFKLTQSSFNFELLH